jgi:hypothetical protein
MNTNEMNEYLMHFIILENISNLHILDISVILYIS